MLVLRDVSADGLSLDHGFASGAITVVLGRNRSGKTRLCRLIAGLDTPRGGAMELDGVDLAGLAPGKRPVALVNQAFVNYPNLTVAENIGSPLRAARVPVAERRARVAEIAQRLQISELLERLPAELSGGQQQRVAIGRALAKPARVLLLDEPLVNLDYKLREALEFELRDMLHSGDLTVIYTSSDPRDAFNLADDVVLLEDGRVLQSGPPLDVYERPSSPAAADLMSDPGVNVFERDGLRFAVRPEHLHLASAAPPQAGTDVVAFVLEVLSVETNGSETYLHGRHARPGGGLEPGEHWVAKLVGLHRVDAGETVTLHAPAGAVLEFAGLAGG